MIPNKEEFRMSQNNNVQYVPTISFPMLLAVLFIGLKLGGIIAWSWWWVLSPIWIPIVLTIFILGLVLIFVD